MPYSLNNNQDEEEVKSNDIFSSLSSIPSKIKSRAQEIAKTFTSNKVGGLNEVKKGLHIAGEVGGAIGDVFGGAVVEPAMKATENVFSFGIKNGIISPKSGPVENTVMGGLKKGAELYSEAEKKYPQTMQAVGDVSNIASAIPTVKGAFSAAKVAVGATKATLGSAGRLAQSVADLGFTKFSNLAPMTELESGQMMDYLKNTTLAQRVGSKITGSPIKDAAGNIIEKPMTSQRVALQQGMMGTQSQIGVQAGRVSSEIKNIIEPILETSNGSFIKSKAFSKMREYINKQVVPGRRKDYEEALMEFADDYSNVPEYSRLKSAQTLKSQIDLTTPKKVFKSGADLANEYKQLEHIFADSIRQQTYDSLGGAEAKKLYQTWGKMIELENLGRTSMAQKRTLFGSNFLGRLMDTAVVPVATTANQMIYSLGGFLQFKGRPGIKKFGDYIKDVYGDGQLLLNEKAGPSNYGPIKMESPGVNDGVSKLKQSTPATDGSGLMSQSDIINNNPLLKAYHDKLIPENVKQKLIIDLSKKPITAKELNDAVAAVEKHNKIIRQSKNKNTLVIPKGDKGLQIDLRKK